MPSAPDGVWPISICYISAHARCSWRIKSDRFMRSTGSGFHLELRGICLRSGPFEGPAIVKPPALPEDTYFCLPHASVRQPLPQPEPTNGTGSAKRWQPQTPAMAAGLTDHVWTLREVLLFRVPPWPQPAGV